MFTDALRLIGGQVVSVIAGTLRRARSRRYAEVLACQLLARSCFTDINAAQCSQ